MPTERAVGSPRGEEPFPVEAARIVRFDFIPRHLGQHDIASGKSVVREPAREVAAAYAIARHPNLVGERITGAIIADFDEGAIGPRRRAAHLPGGAGIALARDGAVQVTLERCAIGRASEIGRAARRGRV